MDNPSHISGFGIGLYHPGLQVISLLNPGVFRFKNKIWLLVRVAEGISQKEGVINFPVLNATGNTEIIEVPLNDPDLIAGDKI